MQLLQFFMKNGYFFDYNSELYVFPVLLFSLYICQYNVFNKYYYCTLKWQRRNFRGLEDSTSATKLLENNLSTIHTSPPSEKTKKKLMQVHIIINCANKLLLTNNHNKQLLLIKLSY